MGGLPTDQARHRQALINQKPPTALASWRGYYQQGSGQLTLAEALNFDQNGN